MNSESGFLKKDGHFYGRRKSRPMRHTRTQALEQVIDDYSLEAADDIKTLCDGRQIWFEIGFGGGEHLAEQARQNPDITMIGCEPFLNGASSLARAMVDHDLQNIRVWLDDAVPLLNALPDHALDQVFLLFPDPWPKNRHHKRRFIQPHTLDLLARVMKKGGQLRLATDDNNLAQWMLWHAVQHPAFTWNDAQNGDWATAPDDWVETRYQQKAAQQGRLAHYILFTRKSD